MNWTAIIIIFHVLGPPTFLAMAEDLTIPSAMADFGQILFIISIWYISIPMILWTVINDSFKKRKYESRSETHVISCKLEDFEEKKQLSLEEQLREEIVDYKKHIEVLEQEKRLLKAKIGGYRG